MKKMIKRIVFVLIIVSLVFATGIVIKTGKFAKLEGYMYSFAAEIINSATDSNATSSNATSSDATSSNATSSNVQDCATSSNATSSNATSSNATSSNAQTTETIKVTNTKPNTSNNAETEEIEEVQTELTYNNSEITQEVLANISNSTETQSLIINLDNNVNISEDIFEAIKGKEIKLTIKVGENQIIFNGKNITTPKDINAEISYNLVSEDSLLKEVVEEGVVINFANNGELPGTAIIKIKVTDEIQNALNMETILVYHYDEETKELTQMPVNATYKEGFIEFSINHNSKYLFVNEAIEEREYIVATKNEKTEVKNKVSFLESHKMYIMIIGASVIAIIIVVIILIVDKKSKAKRNVDADQNEEKID